MGRHPRRFGRIMRSHSSTYWGTSRIRSIELQFVVSLLCCYAVFCNVHASARASPNESISPEYYGNSSANKLEGLLNGNVSSQITFEKTAVSLPSSAKKDAWRMALLVPAVAVAATGFIIIATVIAYCFYQRSSAPVIPKQVDFEKFAQPKVRRETILSITDAKSPTTATPAEDLPNGSSDQQRRTIFVDCKLGSESELRGNYRAGYGDENPSTDPEENYRAGCRDETPPTPSSVFDFSDASQKRRWTTFPRTSYGRAERKNSEFSQSPISKMGSPSIALCASDLKRATRNFGSKIGVGGFGSVYFGKLPGSQMEVAVKVQAQDSQQGAREFATEVEILSRCKHPNLVSLVGYSEEPGRYMLVYEFLGGGTLQQRLYGTRCYPPLDWNTRLNIAIQAAKGLEYLHNDCVPSIIHRDVKSCNILLTKFDDAKVSDFGLSKFLAHNKKYISRCSVKGTSGYLDPEYFETQELTRKSDIYSFGVVLLEVISGLEPLERRRQASTWRLTDWSRKLLLAGEIESVADKALNGKYEKESMWTVADLAMACVEPRSVHRPTISQVVLDLQNALRAESNPSTGATSLSS